MKDSRFSSLTFLVLIVAILATLAVLTGCDRTKQAAGTAPGMSAGTGFAWNANINGNGTDVTGGSFGVQKQAQATPYIEQLEKGNSAKVQAQLKAAAVKDILPTPTPEPNATVCVGGTCTPVYVPYAEATAVRSSEPAWYNGFLPSRSP